ncbi:MAG: hypothetical protein HDT32_01025, partial [Clostridiales bacterium]|nr:hypothetical protein [Clostridiales bacterium]
MNIRKRKLKGYVALSVMIIVCMLLASAMTFFMPNTVNAFSLTDGSILDSQATNLGEMLLEGYENGGKVFDEGTYWELISQISGVTSPNKRTLDNLGATPISSDQIRGFNDGKDVTVTIGGKKWTAAYVSRSKTDAPILTLWLATSTENKIQTSYWTTHSANAIGNYPSNMYGTSYMRASILNNGGGYAESYNATSLTPIDKISSNEWAIYTMSKAEGVAGSITNFIEVPDNMKWQHEQKALDYITSSAYTNSWKYNNNNDALDYGGNVSIGDYATNSYVKTESYSAWAKDKIWLPSVAETGVSGEEGLWMLSNNQRANGTYSWLRTGHHMYYDNVGLLLSSGSGYDAPGTTFSSASIRPAFHLNLKLAAENAGDTGLAEPSDITVEYDGEVWNSSNFTKVPTEQKTWFDSSKMTVTFPSNVKDAGTYQVTVTITSDNEFVGTPSAGESDRVRYFNFTIVKKKIGVTISPDGKSVESEDICEKDVGTERAPTFGLTYSGIKDTSYNTPEVYPSAAGNYRATAKILTNGNNYELTGTITKDFEIKAKDVDKPTITGLTSLPYNGEEQSFTINASADVIITAPEGMRYEGGKLYAKKVGTYKIKMSLVDDGVAKQWTDLKNSKDR